MPLVKRTVLPTALCRNKLPGGLKNELECVTNNTLSGVINQLATLSQHAENIFGELFSEANSFYGRASSLKDRIESLSVKVTQLDSNIEEVQLIDINSRKAFKSSILTDQQVVSRQSLPKSVLETYNKADAPPPLQDLNQFRDDGKDGLKIYTDPDYFFNLWREAIQKETREAKEKRREQRRKDKKVIQNMRRAENVRQAVNTRKQQAQRMRHGAEFIETSSPTSHSQSVKRTSSKKPQQSKPQNEYVPTPAKDQSPDYNDLPPPSEMPPPADDLAYPGVPPPEPPLPSVPSPYDLPPPMDPPPPVNNVDMRLPDPVSHAPPPPPAPAPPPPPPPPAPAPAPGFSNTANPMSGLGDQLQNVSLRKAEPQAAPVVDERSNLLQAIRLGINLKKVEEKERSQAPTSASNDVASILARRIAVEFSDSDVSDSTYASDDDWDD